MSTAPKPGQVWASANSASKFHVIAVFADGGVSCTPQALVAGTTGTMLDYSAEVWAGMVEHSGLTLEADADSDGDA